jgi:hypothetical protein
MRLRVLAIAALVAVVVAGAFVAHSVLPSYFAAQKRAIGSNVSVSGSRVPTSIKADGTRASQTPFASYVGIWHVHDATLTINADRTGLEWWNAGPCTPVVTEMCSGNAKITFTVNPDGSITGTTQSVWYTQQDGGPAPAVFQPDPHGDQAGDTFELQHDGAHLLYTTWFGRLSYLNNSGGNPYWCDSYALYDRWYQCGA